MKRWKILSLVITGWLVGVVLYSTPKPTTLLIATNSVRHKAHLQSLSPSQYLEKSARKKCEYMQSTNKFEHGDWASFIPWTYSKGENLARGFKKPKDVVAAWVASPTHYKNLVGDYNEVGFAECDGPLGRVTVQHLWLRK